MIASVGKGLVLTANIKTQRAVDQRQDEVWVADSGATDKMTHDPGGLKDYQPDQWDSALRGPAASIFPSPFIDAHISWYTKESGTSKARRAS